MLDGSLGGRRNWEGETRRETYFIATASALNNAAPQLELRSPKRVLV